MDNIESKGEIVMYQPDETIRLEVRMDEDTVWLTQQQMAELFDTDRSSIVKHINNIYDTEELEEDPTCAKIAHVPFWNTWVTMANSCTQQSTTIWMQLSQWVSE